MAEIVIALNRQQRKWLDRLLDQRPYPADNQHALQYFTFAATEMYELEQDKPTGFVGPFGEGK